METHGISGSSILSALGILIALFTVFKLLTPTLKFVANIDAVFIFFCNIKWLWVVKLLLRFGANSNAWKKRGRTVLIEASAKGQGDIVLALLENGADVNWQARGDITALMVASKGGYSDTVDVLISKGADVNCATRNGRTALIYALKRANHKNQKGKRDYSQTVNRLLDAGAKKVLEIDGKKRKAIEFLPKKNVLKPETRRRLL